MDKNVGEIEKICLDCIEHPNNGGKSNCRECLKSRTTDEKEDNNA